MAESNDASDAPSPRADSSSAESPTESSHTSVAVDFLQPSQSPGSLGKLAHYEVSEVLGQGGFGIVFKAFDTKLRRTVAIKVIAPEMAATSPARKRFLREARAAAAVRHPNVVQIYSVEEQPSPYLVMEFIDGHTLQQRSNAMGPMSPEDIANIGEQVASGLAAAHKKQLLHRDIKPDNILIEFGSELKIKITDFGLARTADDASLTRSGSIAGTPLYMAPEQALEQTLDHRADLFSLGSVLYLMATGRPPFRAATSLAVLKRVVDDTPRPISVITPEVPTWICAIIAKLHAKAREDRFQSAEEVSELLTQCLDQLRSGEPVTAANHIVKQFNAKAGRIESRPAIGTPKMMIIATCLLAVSVLALSSMLQSRMQARQDNAAATSSATTATEEKGAAPVQAAVPDGDAVSEVVTIPKPDKPVVSGPANAPFSKAEASAYQQWWAKELNLEVEFTIKKVGMKFRLIPPGKFQMGSSDGEIAFALAQTKPGDPNMEKDVKRSFDRETRKYEVTLTHPFYMAVCEVTQKEYKELMNENPSTYTADKQPTNSQRKLDESNPVETISWHDAVRFCNMLSEHEGLKPQYKFNGLNKFEDPKVELEPDGNGYRLPTEAEWEFACRAGTDTVFWTGDAYDGVRPAEWIAGSGKVPHAVGTSQVNPFGLYDMLGNVLEWVEDSSAEKIERVSTDPRPVGGQGHWRFLKGGAIDAKPHRVRPAVRQFREPTFKSSRLGFRVVLPIEQTTPQEFGKP